MTQNRFWLSTELDGVEIQASSAKVATGQSADFTITSLLGESNLVCPGSLGVCVDITVQGGTQASVDFDLQAKINGKYGRVARRNITPASGVQAFIMSPTADGGTGPSILLAFETYRVAWTFNTPGGTPTITFSLSAFAWGYRNLRTGYPGMRD